MSESLRWKLCLGCLLVAALEAPKSALLVLEDLEGPYAAPAPAKVAARAGARNDVVTVARTTPIAELSLVGLNGLTVRFASVSMALEHERDLERTAARARGHVP